MADDTRPRRMLGLDASAVPILYRFHATDPDGTILGEATAYRYQNEAAATAEAIKAALKQDGHPDATVTFQPA